MNQYLQHIIRIHTGHNADST